MWGEGKRGSGSGAGAVPPARPAMGLGRRLLLRPRQRLSRLRVLLEEISALREELRNHLKGLPWWSSASDSAILMQGTWVQSLTRELHLACHS